MSEDEKVPQDSTVVPNNPEEDTMPCAEEAVQPCADADEAASEPLDCQRPQRPRKKRRLLSLLALVLALVALFGLLALAAYLYCAYRSGSLAIADIRLAKLGVVLAGVLSFVSIFLAVLAFFLRKQSKAMAVVAVLLATVLLLLCGGAAYVYAYAFGSLETDDVFNKLDRKDLHIVVLQPDGQLVPNTAPPSVPDRAAVDSVADLQEIEWEYLTDENLPQEALEAIHPLQPINHSYLLDGSEQISNYILLGLDKVGSTDTLIIFSIDRYHKKMKMISIPRDSYVRIPEFGSYAKLAYAYNWGGAAWTVGTVNQNFSLNVSEYIAVDFAQLAQIVDYIGGVTVEIDANEYAGMCRLNGVHMGACLLDGKTAVAYSRIRSDSELNRTGRQREVLSSMLNSVKQMPQTSYPTLIRKCLNTCQTSFSADNLLELALEAVQNGYTIEQYSVLNMVDYWGGRLGKEQYFYCVYDMGTASDRIYRTIYEELYVSGYPDMARTEE